MKWDSEFEGGAWMLQGDYQDYYVDSITGLITIPEPSTYAVIFGAIVLGFVVYRRRK